MHAFPSSSCLLNHENSLFTELEWVHAHEDLMRFKKAKRRALHLGPGPSRVLMQTGGRS